MCFYPSKYPRAGMVWSCAFRDTLVRKFPDLRYAFDIATARTASPARLLPADEPIQ